MDSSALLGGTGLTNSFLKIYFIGDVSCQPHPVFANTQSRLGHFNFRQKTSSKKSHRLHIGFTPSLHVEQVKALEKALSGEVLMHLEFLQTKEGEFNCSGLQLVHYTTEARLNEIMDIYRSHGVQINNPHVYIIEDGKQNNLDPAVVKMKERFDPFGLLNPGKLRSWVQR